MRDWFGLVLSANSETYDNGVLYVRYHPAA